MGLFEKVFGRKSKQLTANAGRGSIFQTLTAYAPVFTTWGGQLYEDELIRATVDAIARHTSKLRIEFQGSARADLKSAVQMGPNDWQTWPVFLRRLRAIYEIYNNAIIVPVLDDYGRTTGFFPVLPTQCELTEYEGELFLRYTFANGTKAAIEYSRCAILPKHQLKDDYFGESNRALDPTLSLLDMDKQGIEEGIKNSATFRFWAKVGNFTKSEDLAKERERFNRDNLRGESNGILLFPSTYTDMKQIESKPFAIDAEQKNLIQQNVFNYFGVNEKVLQSSAIGDDLDAFYEGIIEPFAMMLGDGLTRMIFTPREIGTHNRIAATSNRLQYMSTGNKIAFARDLGDRGVLKIDEIRELFNYEPLPDGAGQHTPIRGEYYFGDEGKEDQDGQEEDSDGNSDV